MRLMFNNAGLFVQNQLNKSNKKLGVLSAQLSSGTRITSVKEDAAGHAIASKLELQANGLEKASKNTMDGVSMVQTLDGALASMTDMLQRGRELSVQASNDTNSQEDRMKMQLEMEQILDEIDNMQDTVTYNNIDLLGGDATRLSYNVDATGNDISNISEIGFISDNVPEGTLEYTIDEVGTPARIENVVLPSGNVPKGVTAEFNINGAAVVIEADDTGDDIAAKMLEAFDVANLEYENGVLYTADEGAFQEITFTGDTSVLTTLGVSYGAYTAGTDAVLSGVQYVDAEGNPIDSFNDTMAVSIEGNDVKITAINNQVIELDINFGGVDADGDFYVGDSVNQTKIDDVAGLDAVGQITNNGGIIIQMGQNKGMELEVYLREINTETLGLDTVNVSTFAGAQKAITQFDNALDIVNNVRAKAGAYQNRFETASKSLDGAAINIRTSLSRIRDVDMAQAIVDYSLEEVKLNAGMSIMAQANERPKTILQLF